MHAWRGALVAAALNAAGMPFDYFLARDVANMPFYPSASSALVAVGRIVVLLIRRKRATVRLGSTVFLINTLVMLVALWITSGYWAQTPAWTPFQANKLGALAVPLVTPELMVGLVSIAGFAGMAIAKFYVLDPEIQRHHPTARCCPIGRAVGFIGGVTDGGGFIAGLNIGAGLRWQTGGHWGVRPEMKVLVADNSSVRFSTGLYYQFGR